MFDALDELLGGAAADDPFEDLLGGSPGPAGGSDATPADNGGIALELANRGFCVFPIFDWGGEGEWKPVEKWPEKASRDPKKVRNWWRRFPDARVGLACGEGSGVSVLDLDIKGGRNGVAALAQLGFPDLVALSPVRVRTPSGGWHLFFQYEARLKNSVSKIGSGIDVKTAGGFVLAPGSWKSGKRYAPVGEALGSVDLPSFPEALIPSPEPERSAVEPLTEASAEQREWAAAQLASRADELAAMREGGRNDELNKAAMWAGGAAAHGFVTEDEARAALWAAAETAGLRLREFNQTFRSGWRAGLTKPVAGFPLNITPDDFDDLPDTADTPVPSSDPIERMNKRHAVVVVRGRTLITTEHANGAVDFSSPTDIRTLYANEFVSSANKKSQPIANVWLTHKRRRTYPDGVTFSPGGAPNGALNLWRGWAVEPEAGGSCSRVLNHIREIVCGGDEVQAAYVLGWLAHLVQRPGEKPGVALILRGAKGAGKDTVADYVTRMIGRRHVPTVAAAEHVTGRFNARLEAALLLHIQEGLWAGDRDAERVLKYLVTSETVEVERKGIDSFSVPSVLRLFISANAEWVVPASVDERRWAVFEVSDRRCGDAAYFDAMRAEMNGDGPAGLLHWLQNYDLSGFDVRRPPNTSGLRDQKLASLHNVERWLFELLARGELPDPFSDGAPWSGAWTSVSRNTLRDEYFGWMRQRRFDGETLDERAFGRRLREMIPELGDSRKGTGAHRVRVYEMPPLEVCRASFSAWLRSPVDWALT